ncbi:MAG: hypothetical protein WKG06_22160 [Segetibacter sp.]
MRVGEEELLSIPPIVLPEKLQLVSWGEDPSLNIPTASRSGVSQSMQLVRVGED